MKINMQNLRMGTIKNKHSSITQMLTIILAESSLELVPRQMYNHPSVTSYCKKFNKNLHQAHST